MCMKHSITRKPTNITLDPVAIAEAKELKINLSQACESGLRAEIAKRKTENWKKNNRTALLDSNDWVSKNELPLADHRQF